MTFREFQNINTERCNEWHDINGWSLSDWAVAMAGECGEACNVIKKMNRKRDSITNEDPEEYDELAEALGKEIADTVTYAFLLAERCGFDMQDIVTRKFNEVSRKHGFRHRILKTDGERDRLRDLNLDLLEAAKIAEEYMKLIDYKPTNRLKIITDAIRKAEGEINAE